MTLASATTLLSFPMVTLASSQSLVAPQSSPSLATIAPTPQELALDYRPPIDRNPKRTRGSGTRGTCPTATSTPGTWMRLLVPSGNYAEQTTAGHPIFSWYLTQASSTPLEFALIAENGTNFLYQKRIEHSPAGVNQLQLPDSVPALAPGTLYEWSVTLICDEFDSSKNISYYAWIERTSATGTLPEVPQPQLSPTETEADPYAPPIEPEPESVVPQPFTPWRESVQHQQVVQFAADGQWYDALALLVEAHTAYPDNPHIEADLISLLEQGGLDDVVERWESPESD